MAAAVDEAAVATRPLPLCRGFSFQLTGTARRAVYAVALSCGAPRRDHRADAASPSRRRPSRDPRPEDVADPEADRRGPKTDGHHLRAIPPPRPHAGHGRVDADAEQDERREDNGGKERR